MRVNSPTPPTPNSTVAGILSKIEYVDTGKYGPFLALTWQTAVGEFSERISVTLGVGPDGPSRLRRLCNSLAGNASDKVVAWYETDDNTYEIEGVIYRIDENAVSDLTFTTTEDGYRISHSPAPHLLAV